MTRAECIGILKEMLKVREGEMGGVVTAISFAISILERVDEERIEKMLVGFRFQRKGIMRFPDRNVKHLASAIVRELENK